ncbi:hypothetical protein VNO77_04811 [Canavalia gladiata]|uniref:CCG-binding protein 1 n=1 Tax=Canavalia gladiata TaxID=3824 RepID=A0AAN9R832_CANGL
MKATLIRPCSAPLLLDARSTPTSSTRHISTVCCSSRNQPPHFPKVGPFSQNLLQRALKDPPLIEKTEKSISDYCLTLEGDECYNCWQAYFELKDLKKESPKEEIERLIRRIGSIKALIESMHRIAVMFKVKENGLSVKSEEGQRPVNELKKEGLSLGKVVKSEEGERHFHIPDGLPKSAEELKEEEEARMPDSPHTRLLRRMGKLSSWYAPGPDHIYSL